MPYPKHPCTLLFAAVVLLFPTGSAQSTDTACPTPVVQTKSGPVCGQRARGGPPLESGRDVHAYLGIPFAAPPTGPRRWTPPAPPAAWRGVRSASAFGPSCPQPLPDGVAVATSEDCLSLNVWTTDPEGSRPVLVFLYGGSFVSGSSAVPTYDGTNLAATGPSVVVTVNYRLGALGFLAGPEPFSGNYGILDQQAALRWVHENIAAFGGDPARVTLFGESAGAMSVGIHLNDPTSSALFRAAILESNPYGISYKTREQAGGYARALIEHLDCAEAADVTACLRDRPVDAILEAQQKVPMLESLLLGLASFVPWGPVVGAPPVRVQPNEVPIGKPAIIGTNRNEGALFVALQERAIGQIGEVRYVLETDIAYGDRGRAVRTLYASLDSEEPVVALSRIVTDDVFTCANQSMLDRATGPVFAYQFTHAPSFAIWPRISLCAPETRRVCHGAELPFVFANPFSPNLGAERASFTEKEKRLAGRMLRLWTAFAADLAPPPERKPTWTPFTRGDPLRLLLNEPSSTLRDLGARCRFWNAIGYDRRGPLASLLSSGQAPVDRRDARGDGT